MREKLASVDESHFAEEIGIGLEFISRIINFLFVIVVFLDLRSLNLQNWNFERSALLDKAVRTGVERSNFVSGGKRGANFCQKRLLWSK